MHYLLAILLPPVAVLMTGRIGAFLLNCLLSLCFWVPGIIHALIVVADHKANQRTDRVVQAIRQSK